jgi:hypothetical protein
MEGAEKSKPFSEQFYAKLAEYSTTVRQEEAEIRKTFDTLHERAREGREEKRRAYERDIAELTEVLEATLKTPVHETLVQMIKEQPKNLLQLCTAFIEYAGEVGKGSSYPFGLCLTDRPTPLGISQLAFYIDSTRGSPMSVEEVVAAVKSQDENTFDLGITAGQYTAGLEMAVSVAIKKKKSAVTV